MSRPSSAISAWRRGYRSPVTSSRRSIAEAAARRSRASRRRAVIGPRLCASGILASSSSTRRVTSSIFALEVVVLVEQHPGELGVVLVEAAGQRLDQLGVLDAQPPRPVRPASRGSRSPAISASIIALPETPMMSVATEESFIERVLQQLLQALRVAGPLVDQVEPAPACSRAPRASRRARSSGGASRARSASPARLASILSVFGRPGTFFTSRAFTSQTTSPRASSRYRTAASSPRSTRSRPARFPLSSSCSASA